MMAGVLAHSGYDMGVRLLSADTSNPKGYFEDLDVNAINDALLAPHDPSDRARAPHERALGDGERWLAALPLGVDVRPDAPARSGMAAALRPAPFCRKDPRFCYTLPAWRPILHDTVYVCVFREPARTAHSLLRHTRSRQLGLTFNGALHVWTAMYRHVLARHHHDGDWVFAHYEQVLDGTVLPALERALNARLDHSFPDPILRRSPCDGRLPRATRQVYADLCATAGYPQMTKRSRLRRGCGRRVDPGLAARYEFRISVEGPP
ncbi:MAG: hypothetical protein ACRDN9_01695 [Streptosporangiaceae bacterium]